MSSSSSIEWLLGGATWNPVRGCTACAPECAHCYARTFAERFRGVAGHPYERGFDPRTVPDALDLPLRWKKPRTIFVASMSDPFHDAVPDDYLHDMVGVIGRAHWHHFILLSKRADRMQRFFAEFCVHGIPNLTVGVSVGTLARRGDIDLLRATPAARRMVSFEPLLEYLGDVDLRGIDVAAIGGESGPGARPCNVAWIRNLVRRCRAAGCKPFVKQLGAHIEDRNDAGFDGDSDHSWPEHIGEEDRVEHDRADTGYQGAPVRVRTRDRKGSDPSEWPADLRVREMPEAN